MRKALLLTLSLCTAALTFAQEQSNSYTLNEAINFALENNYKALNASLELQDAQKQKWETIATGLPQIDGNINYSNQLKQPVSLIPGELTGGAPGTFIPVVFGQAQTATATATLRQQLFDGSYIVGVQAIKTFIDYSKNSQEKTAIEVKKAVVQSYGNVLLADESVAILERNKAALEKTLFETTKMYENGLTEEENVDQLNITLSSVKSQLQNSFRLQKLTRQMLNMVMGIPLEDKIELSENLEDLAQQQMTVDILKETFSLKNNVDFKLANNLTEQRFFELKLAKSRALPTLNAFVNYGTNAFSQKFDFLSGNQQWFDSSIMGFDLNIPIFSSFKRSASTARAKIALAQAENQLKEAEETIRLELEKAKSDYLLAVEEYYTSKNNLGLAERIETKNQIKYTEGLASSFDLRQAQTQLYSAQQEFLQTMVNIINQKTTLETILNN